MIEEEDFLATNELTDKAKLPWLYSRDSDSANNHFFDNRIGNLDCDIIKKIPRMINYRLRTSDNRRLEWA
ncbi:hypothetical protein GCM10028773_03290 [Spirosoma koreense]